MKRGNHIVSLKPATKSDYRFLYDLLKERDQRANISHKKMPSYEKHVEFVSSVPYSKWYIIKYKDEKAGSIYLTKHDEIGIFVKKDMHDKGIGKKALKLLMKMNPRSRYLANVSPRNTRSINFFKRNGFQLVQYTYELTNSDVKVKL